MLARWRYRLASRLFRPSRHIGVYYDPKSRKVRKIVNTEWDWQLDDPSHLENGDETLKLLRVPRGDCPREMGMGDCALIQAEAERILGKS